MKNLLKSALAIAALSAPSLALASQWEMDPGHSTASFTVKHMLVTNVKGEFGKVTGVINLDDKDITRSTVTATIDTTTIDTRNEQRDGHLKSPDFFDVAKYPVITFKSKKVEKAGEGKLKVTGDLTIRGVTKETVLDVESNFKAHKHPFNGSMISGAAATTRLNRKDFGLNWNKAIETGGMLVGDDVNVMIDLELIQKDTAAVPAVPAVAKPVK